MESLRIAGQLATYDKKKTLTRLWDRYHQKSLESLRTGAGLALTGINVIII